MPQTSINDHVLTLSADGPRLKGARCADCGNHVFPQASGCSRCTGTNMEPVLLGTEGTLWAWTVQGFPPKAPPYLGETDPKTFQPYGVGYIELPEQLKIEARLTEADPKRLHTGMPMRLTLIRLRQADDGTDLVTFGFEPIH